MRVESINKAIRLADTMAGLLRTTALTVGPPLLRLAGDEKQGRVFTGLVSEPARAPEIETARVHPFGTTITYVCAHCRGPDIRIGCYAEWDDKNQKWEARATYQNNAECAHCGDGVTIMPRPLSQPHAAK
jgi:hypothetical protein